MKKTSLGIVLLTVFSSQAFAIDVVNNIDPYCGCCVEWTKYMQEQGFTVKEVQHENMNSIKQKLGVTPKLASCHTAEIGGYVFEGHIPAEDIKAFLANPPKNAIGLAVPGMPVGAPGMEYGDQQDAYTVYAFNDKGRTFKYRQYQGNK